MAELETELTLCSTPSFYYPQHPPAPMPLLWSRPFASGADLVILFTGLGLTRLTLLLAPEALNGSIPATATSSPGCQSLSLGHVPR